MGGDVGRNDVPDGLDRDRVQEVVAAGAPGEKPAEVEGDRQPCPHLAHLGHQGRLPEEHRPWPGERRQPAVAGEQPAALGAGGGGEHGVGDSPREDGVEPGKTEPPGECSEHRVAGEADLVHGPILLWYDHPGWSPHPQSQEVLMVLDEALREQLAQQDPEFRRLLEEHRSRDRRLKELSGKGWLTSEEEQEEKRLKKEKLQLKDQMEALLRRRAS